MISLYCPDGRFIGLITPEVNEWINNQPKDVLHVLADAASMIEGQMVIDTIHKAEGLINNLCIGGI